MRFVILCLFGCWYAHATMLGPAYSEGVIKKFDEKSVTLVDEEGDLFTVERRLINTKKYRIREGERVMIYQDPLPSKKAK